MSRHRNQTARVEPVVTYSRMEEAARVRAGRRSDLLEIEPPVSYADDAPPSLEPPYIEDFVEEPRLRAVANDSDDGFAEAPVAGEARRPGSMRFILVTAVIAVIAGIGLVGASFSIATIDKDGTPTAVASGEEADAVLAPEAEDTGPVLDLTPGVRQVSTSGSRGTLEPDADSTDVTAAIAPPTPRAKPERTASTDATEPETPADEPVAVAKTSPAPAPKAEAGSTDALIANIEKTLSEKKFEPARIEPAVPQDQARLEDGVPMDGGLPPMEPMDMGGHPTEVYPPAVAEYPPPAETAPVEVLPPPAVMTEAPRRPRLFERWFGWLRPNPPPPPPISAEGLVAAEPLPPGIKLPPADIPVPLPTN